ncbi:MAG: hypothetical protein J3Q66DRAFT_359765 [Benniella sp.]|nr:MAG: hypothetical protein J3Q66DRAFT_359765 [Benniella sp.]
MHLILLHSLSLIIALAAQAIPHVLAAGSKTPFGELFPEVVTIENQQLIISHSNRYSFVEPNSVAQFISLDLSTAWASDAPAWKKLTLRPTGPTEVHRSAALMKDQESILYSANTTTYKYNIKTDAWDKDPYMNWTYPAFYGGAVTDIDTGLMYGVEYYYDTLADPDPKSTRFTTLDPITKNYTYVDITDSIGASMVYSSASKDIFVYSSIMRSYNTTSKEWSLIDTDGEGPSMRLSACLVSAYGGKKLILAGGIDLEQKAAYQDVYIFDVATSVWSRLADAPRPALGPGCAVSGDSFLYWGGAKFNNATELNEEGPAILNLVSNTWGNRYTPSGQTPISSADRPVLFKIGFVALTLVSVVASSLVL